MSEKNKIILLAAIFFICVGAIVVVVSKGDTTVAQSVDPATKLVKTATPIGGSFSMVDHNGNAVTEANYDGSYKLMFFGFTNCPGICPGELAKLSSVLDIIEEAKIEDQFTPLFISVDPARDDVETMREYIELYDKRIIGLTGTEEQVASMKQSYRVYSSPIEMEGMAPDDYMVDHSTYTYLMSPENELLLVFDMDDKPEEIAQEIKSVL